MLAFTLFIPALCDATVLRDGGQILEEVDALGQISGSPAVGEPIPSPATRPRASDAEPLKAVARNHDEWTAVGLSMAVLSQALLDPFALCCVLLLIAYAGMNHLMPKVASKNVRAPRTTPDFDALSTTSSTSMRSRKSRAPDRFALVVNQKLTRLDTIDEVFDYALASSETGRTDIVNAVTAIHRSAKIMAHQPQLQRIKVSQDARLHKLLEHLQKFFDEGGHAPHILARAVGNTSWALAKLQYRQDPDSSILMTLQRVFVEHAQDFRPEELMNTVWAFAELRRDKDALAEESVLAVAQAACKCVDKFPEFSLQQVVYLSWALARLSSITVSKHEEEDDLRVEVRKGLLEFTARIVARCLPDVQKLTTKNLAMLSWAAASLHAHLGMVDTDGPVGSLLVEITQYITLRGLHGFLPGEIASIVWALNKVHIKAVGFFDLFRSYLLQHGLKGFSSQDVSTLLCAFVKSGCGSDELYTALAAKAQANAKDFNRSEKMMVQWAYTQLPHLAPPKL